MSSHERGQKDFVAHFYTQSRLHFIGTWKERYARLLDTLPDSAHGEPPAAPEGKRCVLHVDMDAFFASVSLRDRPELMDKPVVISAATDSSNAEVSCPNYPARAFGVRAGMWMARARELCPDLVSLNYEFDKYTEVAEIMYRALYETTPFVNGVSCDEAYLDVTHRVRDIDEDVEREAAIARIVESLRTTIFERTKCHASVGVGTNMLLARVATARAKPNGWQIFQMDKGGKETLAAMPVRDLPQVGWKGARELEEKLRVETCGDLQRKSLGEIQRHFGPKRGQMFYNLCRGIDTRAWVPNGVKERQTIGTQISWGVRMQTAEEVVSFLEGLCEELVDRIARSEKAGLGAKKVSITLWKAKPNADPNRRKGSLGHGECTILQRTVALHHSVCEASEYLQHATKLLERLECAPTDVRGLGVAASNFARPDRGLRDFFARTPKRGRARDDSEEDNRVDKSPDRKSNRQAGEVEVECDQAPGVLQGKGQPIRVNDAEVIDLDDYDDDDEVDEVIIEDDDDHEKGRSRAQASAEAVVPVNFEDASSEKGDRRKLRDEMHKQGAKIADDPVPIFIENTDGLETRSLASDRIENDEDDEELVICETRRRKRPRGIGNTPLHESLATIRENLHQSLVQAQLVGKAGTGARCSRVTLDSERTCGWNTCERSACMRACALNNAAEKLHAQATAYARLGNFDDALALVRGIRTWWQLHWAGEKTDIFQSGCAQIETEISLLDAETMRTPTNT